MKLPLSGSFAWLCGFIGTLHNCVNVLAEGKLDVNAVMPFAIPAAGWGTDDSVPSHPYYRDFAVTGLTDADIDIPKDFLVKEANIGTVTAADKQEGGKFENDDSFDVGDKYLDFTVNVQTGAAETDSHIYLNVKDLAHVYSAGNGVDISASDEISIKIDSSNARGLSTGANGLALALATPDVYTEGTKTSDGTAGAMSSADKYKLDNALVESDLSDYTEAELRTLLGLPAGE